MFYVAMAVIGGRDGIWAMNQLLEQKRVMSAHTAEIEKTFDELTLEKLALTLVSRSLLSQVVDTKDHIL